MLIDVQQHALRLGEIRLQRERLADERQCFGLVLLRELDRGQVDQGPGVARIEFGGTQQTRLRLRQRSHPVLAEP